MTRRRRPILVTIASAIALFVFAAVTHAAVIQIIQIGLSNTGNLLSYGTSATGAQVCTLDTTGAANLSAALAAPNGGLTTQATPDAGGNCNDATFTALATPTPGPTRPTLVLNANAGTGASISFIAGSTMHAGGISWTAGTSPAAGTQFVVTFPEAFAVVPAAPCVAANRPAAHIGLYSTPTTTTVTVGSDVVPTGGTTYVCQYAVVLP